MSVDGREDAEVWRRIEAASLKLFETTSLLPLSQTLRVHRSQIHRWREGKIQDVRGRLDRIADFLEGSIQAAEANGIPPAVLGTVMHQISKTGADEFKRRATQMIGAASLVEAAPMFSHLKSRDRFDLDAAEHG